MGLYISKAIDKFSSILSPKSPKILMFGLDAAGKTTIINKLKLAEYMKTVNNNDFYHAKCIDYKNLRITIWDLREERMFRRLFKVYYHRTDSIIFILDSCDENRLDIAIEGLHETLEDEELKDIPLLIFANKQDIRTISHDVMINKLETDKFKGAWHLQGTCAITGEGLYEGLEWLSQELKKRQKSEIIFEND